MQTRKLVYYVATSVDGFIERADGSFDGMLTDGQHITDYLTSLRDFDTVLMGRRTYEVGFKYGVEPGQPSLTYPDTMQYVFSGTMTAYDHPSLKVIREDAASFVRRLKGEPGRAIYLCGGGALAASLMAANLVDDIILKVNPVLFGGGVPVFGSQGVSAGLTLLDAKIYNNGAAFMHYQVNGAS